MSSQEERAALQFHWEPALHLHHSLVELQVTSMDFKNFIYSLIHLSVFDTGLCHWFSYSICCLLDLLLEQVIHLLLNILPQFLQTAANWKSTWGSLRNLTWDKKLENIMKEYFKSNLNCVKTIMERFLRKITVLIFQTFIFQFLCFSCDNQVKVLFVCFQQRRNWFSHF